MNITPFANFGNFENLPSPAVDKPTDEAAEDFSAILTNIVAVLQPAEAPPAPASAPAATTDEPAIECIKTPTEPPPFELPPCDVPPPFELPPCDVPPVDTKSFDAKINSTKINSTKINSIKINNTKIIDAKIADVKNLDPKIVDDKIVAANISESESFEAAVVDTKNVDLKSVDGQTVESKVAADNNLLEIPALEPRDLLDEISRTVTKDVRADQYNSQEVDVPQPEALWAGFPTVIKQRINDYKFEVSAKEKLKAQIMNLFKSEAPAAEVKIPTPFKNTDEIPSDLIPELKNQLNNPATNQKTLAGSQTAPLFQAEQIVPIKTMIRRFEKPLDNGDAAEKVKDCLPTTLPNGETPPIIANMPNETIALDTDAPIRTEIVIEETAPLPTASADPIKPPQISEIVYTENGNPADETNFETTLPSIDLKPRLMNNKVKGFDITPTEVSSILKTFDRFFKKTEQASKPGEAVDAKPLDLSESASFEEISKQIRESFAAVMKPNGANAQTKPALIVEQQQLWAGGEKIADDDVKIPLDDFLPSQPTRLNFEPQTVAAGSDFQAFPADNGGEEFSVSLNAKPEMTIKAEKPEIQIDKPQADDFEVHENFRFEKFLENVSKDQKITADVRAAEMEPKKILEQVNPQLLKLAALTDKKLEKQTLKMRLNPAELGSVEIRLERNEHGVLNAYFHTESEGAQQVLSQNIEHLRETLQSNGWQVGQMDVTCGAGSSSGNQQRESAPRQSFPGETYNFSRTSDIPDSSESKNQNRLLSLLA